MCRTRWLAARAPVGACPGSRAPGPLDGVTGIAWLSGSSFLTRLCLKLSRVRLGSALSGDPPAPACPSWGRWSVLPAGLGRSGPRSSSSSSMTCSSGWFGLSLFFEFPVNRSKKLKVDVSRWVTRHTWVPFPGPEGGYRRTGCLVSRLGAAQCGYRTRKAFLGHFLSDPYSP